MIFIEHSRFNDTSVKGNLGAPQYSYHFVRKAFEPVLDRLGRRVSVEDPEREVDAIYSDAKTRGEPCVFLAFNPPHKITPSAVCPTIPVFAWEYDTIPNEVWDGDEGQNWCGALARSGQAITLSKEAADAVRRAMGDNFPVWPMPAPLFDVFSRLSTPAYGWRPAFDIELDEALAISTRNIDLSMFRPDRSTRKAERALRILGAAHGSQTRPQRVRLEGVIYTAVFSPADDRKNWRDLLTGFIWAFRRTPDATLVLKLTHSVFEDWVGKILEHMSVLGPFDCRVVLIHGMLSSESYAGLIDKTAYYVNTATAEGQCLPLTEYLSCGRPALAPAHTSMLDYVTPENAFVLASEEQPAFWPQDERKAFRCRHHLVSFADLVRKFRESYAVAKHQPERYQQKSQAAVQTMRAFCSEKVVAAQLSEALMQVHARHVVDGEIA